MNSRGRRGVAEVQAALLMAVVSISMAYVVYSQSRVPHSSNPVFVNTTQLIEGQPSLLIVQSNGSRVVSLRSLLIDGAPPDGILSFDGSGYSAAQSLCLPGSTTFFSTFALRPGILSVATDGRSWIAGSWSASEAVSSGWNEVIISDGSSCSVTLPDGSTVASVGPRVSRAPVTGDLNSSSFKMFVPWGRSGHVIQLVFAEGVDSFEV